MQEMTGISRRIAPLHRDLRALLQKTVYEHGNETAYKFRCSQTEKIIERTFSNLYDDIISLGIALDNEIYQKTHEDFLDSDFPELARRRIAVIGPNSYSYVLAINAALFSSSITVPLDNALTNFEVVKLLDRSRASIFFVDAGKKNLLDNLLENPPTHMEHLIIMGDHPFIKEAYEATAAPEDSGLQISYLSNLYNAGQQELPVKKKAFESIAIDPHAISSICFTSGTTSSAKGVMITQQNITANVRMVEESIDFGPDRIYLSMLPMHHTFENAAHYIFWSSASPICINDSLRNFSKNLREWHVNTVFVVPLVMEKIYKQIQLQMKKTKKEKLVNRLIGLSNFLRKLKIDLRKPMFKAIRDRLAPDLDMVIVGAAPMKKEIQKFFNDIGIINYQGYGMTECSPLISNNSHWAEAPGSAGQPCA